MATDVSFDAPVKELHAQLKMIRNTPRSIWEKLLDNIPFAKSRESRYEELNLALSRADDAFDQMARSEHPLYFRGLWCMTIDTAIGTLEVLYQASSNNPTVFKGSKEHINEFSSLKMNLSAAQRRIKQLKEEAKLSFKVICLNISSFITLPFTSIPLAMLAVAFAINKEWVKMEQLACIPGGNKEYYRYLTCAFVHADDEHLNNNLTVLIPLLVVSSLLFWKPSQKQGFIAWRPTILLWGLYGFLAVITESLHNFILHLDKFKSYGYSMGASGVIMGFVGFLLVYYVKRVITLCIALTTDSKSGAWKKTIYTLFCLAVEGCLLYWIQWGALIFVTDDLRMMHQHQRNSNTYQTQTKFGSFLDLIFSSNKPGKYDNVDHLAHTIGFLIGVLLATIVVIIQLALRQASAETSIRGVKAKEE